MLRKGFTYRSLGKELGVSGTYLYAVFTDQRPGRRVRRDLIERFGFPPELLEYEPPRKVRAA